MKSVMIISDDPVIARVFSLSRYPYCPVPVFITNLSVVDLSINSVGSVKVNCTEFTKAWPVIPVTEKVYALLGSVSSTIFSKGQL